MAELTRDERVEMRPTDVRTTGFSDAAFGATMAEREITPLPEDSFPDILDRMSAQAEGYHLAVKWTLRPSLILNLILALVTLILVRVATSKPNVEPYVSSLRQYCFDPKCVKSTTDVGSLLPLSQNEQAQEAVARTLLPEIFHQAFTISTAEQDQYDWTHYVLPYVERNSEAADYFSAYLKANNIGKVATEGSTTVTVDPVGAPAQLNQYFVGWRFVTTNTQGVSSPEQREFANVTITWGPATELNRNGLYIAKIETVKQGT